MKSSNSLRTAGPRLPVCGNAVVVRRSSPIKFRDSTVTTRNRIREMMVRKKTRDENWQNHAERVPLGPLQMTRSLDGAIAELQ